MRKLHAGAHRPQGEKLSDYFKAENGELIVRRFELQAILDRLVSEMQLPWYLRLKRAAQRYYVQSATTPIRNVE